MNHPANEILLNSSLVSTNPNRDYYEFVLNDNLLVLECVKVISQHRGQIRPIHRAAEVLEGKLFELNHVRVNPALDNQYIIRRLTMALKQIDVEIYNSPDAQSMAMCYRPLGEISDCVRFYMNPIGKLIFLSPSMRPRLVKTTPASRKPN